MTIKLSKEDIQRVSEDPFHLFLQGLRSPATKTKYSRVLKLFVCVVLEEQLLGDPELRSKQLKQRLKKGNKKEIESFLDVDFEIRVKEFVDRTKQDPQWTMDILLTYSEKLKERTELSETEPNYLNPQTFSNFFKPIKKLFDMNGVPFTWKRINATFPDLNNDNETRGYDREEIQHMLEFAGPLEKAIILISSSSGIRRGGFDFTWDCVHPVYKKNDNFVMGNFDDEDDSDLICGMITIYKKTSEQYMAMFSTEAWHAIKNYKIQWRKETGQFPKPKHPFLKQSGIFVKKLSIDSGAQRILNLLHRSGLRDNLVNGKRRHEIPVMNGFRRFFNKINKETLSDDSPLASLIKKELMMSHTGLIHLDKNYFKTHWQELVKEYLNAIPSLTISAEERVKAENKKLRKEKSELEITRDELEKMKKDVRILKEFGKIIPKDSIN